LTSDADTFAFIKRQIIENPGLAIGGPSIHWLYEALAETRALSKMDAPDYETMCLLGNDEKVVDKRDVVQHLMNWPSSRLEMIKGARHEVMMETAPIRKNAFDLMDAFWSA